MNHRSLVNHNGKFIYTNNPITCPLVKDRLWIMKHNSVFSDFLSRLYNGKEVIATSSNVPGSNVNGVLHKCDEIRLHRIQII